MKIDGPSGGEIFNASVPDSDAETSILRSDGQVILTPGFGDVIHISQDSNVLKIHINDSSVLSLTPEESRNLQILPGKRQVSVAENVSLPIRGLTSKEPELQLSSPIDPSAAATRKEENSLSANLKRNLLVSELGAGIIQESPKPVNNEKRPTAPMQVPDEQVIESAMLQRQPVDFQMPPAVTAPRNQSTNTLVASISTPINETFDINHSSIGEKIAFIQDAVEQSLTPQKEQLICSILCGAPSPDEFNQIVNDRIGNILPQVFQSDEIKTLWDRLVGGYGRFDLAIDPSQALEMKAVLLQPQEAVLNRTNPLTGEIDLNIPDRSADVNLTLINKMRELGELPPLIAEELRTEVFEIIQQLDSAIPFDALQEIKQRTGLTDFQLREVVSRPMAELFESALTQLIGHRDSQDAIFVDRLQQAVQKFGQDSVAVEITKAERDEFLQGIRPQISVFAKLTDITSQIFSGPTDPLVKIDRFTESVLSKFTPDIPQLLPIINNIAQGAAVFQNRQLETALVKITAFQYPEIREAAHQALPFVRSVFDGKYSSLLREISRHSQEYPLISKSADFLDRLLDSTFSRQINGFGRITERIVSIFDQSFGAMSQWGKQSVDRSSSTQRDGLMAAGIQMMTDFAGEILKNRIDEFSRAAAQFASDPRFNEVIEAVKTGSDLMIAFRKGRFIQILAALNQRMAGSPAVQQIIEQALHLTTIGSSFFHTLLNRDWERSINQAVRKSPGNREVRDVEAIFSDALNLFLPLESVQNLNPFLQYKKQLASLKDEELRSQLMTHYQAQARELIQTLGASS
jgi:hypothetical protein